MTENDNFDLSMLKRQIDTEILFRTHQLKPDMDLVNLLELCKRAVGLAEVGIATYAYALDQIQNLTAEVQRLEAVTRG